MILLVEAGEVASYHHRHQTRRAEFRAVKCPDIGRVAQNGHAIGELINLLHPMAYVDDGDPLRLQRGDHPEQFRGLARGEGGRRLVHDDDARVGRERARDLDHLPLAERQRRNACAGGERKAKLLQHRAATLCDLAPIRNAETAWLVAEKDVFADREIGSKRQLLIDDGDTVGARGDRIAFGDRRAIDENLAPGVRRIGARENFDEGRFSGAVLAHERVKLAGADRERYVFQRLHGVEGLADVPHLENWTPVRGIIAPDNALSPLRPAHRPPAQSKPAPLRAPRRRLAQHIMNESRRKRRAGFMR